MFSVIFKEVFRFLIYLLLDKTDSYLKKLTENEETQIFANKYILAYGVGLGFGLMSGAFSLVNVQAASIGPGTLGFHCEAHNFFIVSSIMTLCMILLNTAWGVIFFASIDSGMISWNDFNAKHKKLFMQETVCTPCGLSAPTCWSRA